MNDHIPDPTKMISDTPRTDAEAFLPHDSKYRVCDADFARQLERELNAANEMFRKLNIHALNLADRIKRLEEELMDAKNQYAVLVADVALYEDRGERIKRLEEAGDVLCAAAAFMGWHMEIEKWNKSKEAKP